MVDSPISPVRRTRDSQFPAPKSRVVLDEFSVSLTRDQWLALCALAEPYATKDFSLLTTLATIYYALDQNTPFEEACCRYPCGSRDPK
jgi:hypothetical protein